jgi:hypothetical protein
MLEAKEWSEAQKLVNTAPETERRGLQGQLDYSTVNGDVDKLSTFGVRFWLVKHVKIPLKSADQVNHTVNTSSP